MVASVRFHRLAVECEYNFHMFHKVFLLKHLLMYYEDIAVQHHHYITGNESNKAILA